MPAPDYVRPASLSAAFGLLERDDARLVAGGTDVILRVPPDIGTLIDLSALDLDGIVELEGGYRIGAMSTLTQILEHPGIGSLLDGYVAGMLRQVGSPLLRNLATIGGHIARGRISDIIPVLLTLDAAVSVYDGSDRTVSLQEYLDAGAGRSGAIVTAVVVPHPPGGTAAEFLKFGRTAFDLALLNCACLVRMEGGAVASARVVIGETPLIGSRLPGVEAALVGTDLGLDVIEQASELARTTVETGTDLRASAGYRKQLAAVATRRCLTAIRERLREARP